MGSCQSQGLNRPLKVRAKKGEREKRRINQKVERWLLMLHLNWDREVAGKQGTGSEFQSKAVRGKILDEYHRVFALGTDTV